jgi:hypothetical protein
MTTKKPYSPTDRSWSILVHPQDKMAGSLMTELTEEEARQAMRRLQSSFDPWSDRALRRMASIDVPLARRNAMFTASLRRMNPYSSYTLSLWEYDQIFARTVDGDSFNADAWHPSGRRLKVWPNKPKDWGIRLEKERALLEAEIVAEETRLGLRNPPSPPVAVADLKDAPEERTGVYVPDDASPPTRGWLEKLFGRSPAKTKEKA